MQPGAYTECINIRLCVYYNIIICYSVSVVEKCIITSERKTVLFQEVNT